MGTADVVRQWEAWQRSGEWTARDERAIRLLGVVPAATTRQLADWLFGDEGDSALVRTRRHMRSLWQRGVVTHDHLTVGQVGRPEDIYRLTPTWAAAMGYQLPPLADDRLVNWFVAERMVAGLTWNEALIGNPAGHSRADWEQRRMGSGQHVHVYEYMVASAGDAERMAAGLGALLTLIDAAAAAHQPLPWERCPHDGDCRLWLVGWDVECTFRGERGVSPWMTWMTDTVPRLETVQEESDGHVLWEIRTFYPEFAIDVDREIGAF